MSERADASAPLSLLVIDVDEFKKVNDNFSHTVGNEVLLGIASVINSVCNGKGRCYRWGGDELAILLPNYSGREAVVLAERVREVLSTVNFEGYPNKVTLSIGIASFPGTSKSLELFSNADQALRDAKNSGRNRIHQYSATR